MDTQLEEMREQLATLKKKLDKQEIVNERLIRQLMGKNVVGVNRTNLWLNVLCVLMIPFGYLVFVTWSGYSIAFWIFTSLFLLSGFIYTYLTGKDLRNSRLMQEDLLEVRRKVARIKKLDHNQFYFGFIVFLIWVVWLGYEIHLHGGFSYGGLIGGAIGTVFGVRFYNKTQRQYQEIINQIEDLTADQ